MLARLKAGVLTDLGTGPRGSAEWPDSERVEIDEVAPHSPGARLVLDPKNPRRAIVAPPTYAELRRAARARAIDLEIRRAAAERLNLTAEAAALAAERDAALAEASAP